MENNFINIDKLLYIKKFPAIESELYTFENPIFDKKGFYYCYGGSQPAQAGFCQYSG